MQKYVFMQSFRYFKMKKFGNTCGSTPNLLRMRTMVNCNLYGSAGGGSIVEQTIVSLDDAKSDIGRDSAYGSVYCRTNVLGDYIEKLANDVHILTLQYDMDEDGEGIPAQIAWIQAIIIICIVLYICMVRDRDDNP